LKAERDERDGHGRQHGGRQQPYRSKPVHDRRLGLPRRISSRNVRVTHPPRA
jgi:hypothetical protein